MSGTQFFNNASEYGGGAYISGDGTITNTSFISNTASLYSGGLQIVGVATVSGSTFTDNTAQDDDGGGAYFYDDATISDSSFTGNSAGEYGGGAYIYETGVITNTSFISNTAQEYGGGLEIDGVATVIGSTFADNTAQDDDGGGAYFYDDATISDSSFTGNSAGDYGGGAYLSNTAGITSTSFISNTAQDEGGALFIAGSSGSTIRTSRLLDNTAVNGGGALYLASAEATLENNFVGGNSGPNGAADIGLGASPTPPPSSLTATYNTFAAATAGQGVAINAGKDVAGDTVTLTNTIFDGYATALQAGTNAATITADSVLFSNVTTPTDTLGGTGTINVTNAVTGTAAFVDAAARDYHLTKVSAAIDQGVASSVTTDIDGQTRPNGSASDLGADEFVNEPPTITATFGDQTTTSGTPVGPLPFTVADANGDPLTVTATSSNQALVPDANVVISGSGANRTVTVTPLPGQTGTTIITITVSDGTTTATYTFTVTVTSTPANTPPTIRPRSATRPRRPARRLGHCRSQ